MTINRKANKKKEDVEAKKMILLTTLEKDYKGCFMNCQYNQDLDQFIVYRFIDKNDDDAFYTIKLDYEEVI